MQLSSYFVSTRTLSITFATEISHGSTPGSVPLLSTMYISLWICAPPRVGPVGAGAFVFGPSSTYNTLSSLVSCLSFAPPAVAPVILMSRVCLVQVSIPVSSFFFVCSVSDTVPVLLLFCTRLCRSCPFTEVATTSS